MYGRDDGAQDQGATHFCVSRNGGVLSADLSKERGSLHDSSKVDTMPQGTSVKKQEFGIWGFATCVVLVITSFLLSNFSKNSFFPFPFNKYVLFELVVDGDRPTYLFLYACIICLIFEGKLYLDK